MEITSALGFSRSIIGLTSKKHNLCDKLSKGVNLKVLIVKLVSDLKKDVPDREAVSSQTEAKTLKLTLS